jgi:hypothetical protein
MTTEFAQGVLYPFEEIWEDLFWKPGPGNDDEQNDANDDCSGCPGCILHGFYDKPQVNWRLEEHRQLSLKPKYLEDNQPNNKVGCEIHEGQIFCQ